MGYIFRFSFTNQNNKRRLFDWNVNSLDEIQYMIDALKNDNDVKKIKVEFVEKGDNN